MKLLIYFLTTIICFGTLAQNGKSQRMYKKAEEAMAARDFKSGKAFYQKAIEADETNEKAYLRLAAIHSLYRVKDSALLYYEGYTQVTPPPKINSKIWLNIADLNYQLGRYQRASAAIQKVRSSSEQSDYTDRLENNINFAILEISKGTKLEIEELPPAINQFQLQYFPVMTVDGQSIFYTKRNGSARQFDEDIVHAKLMDKQWSNAQSVSENINTTYNEGACTISADGRMLIFTACEGDRVIYGSCDLFISYKKGDKWSIPENMGSVINSKHWDSQPSLSGDGRTLYFSSDRPGGYGKRDIWMSTNSGTSWSKPINLGAKVNSSFDETTPFIHVNNQSLFFASNGFNNMGGFDLFLTTKQKENGWSYPENLGYPINTFQDELSLFINAAGTRSYYSIENNFGQEASSKLVSFRLNNDSLIYPASYVTGIIRDEDTNAALEANLEMVNLSDSTDTYITRSDSTDGRYFLVLKERSNYGVFIDKKNYLFEDITFKATSRDALKPDTLDIFLSPIKKGKSVVIDNIYFSFDEYTLNQESMAELKSIVRFMKNNKDLKFLIEGHTDKRGQASYNQQLSENRAKSVYDFLVNRGISRDRLDFKGFGASQPLAEGDQNVNRRIEFRLF
ncbi:MAG: OmpA family protein [Cyclobacteriaceae bacterium]